MNKPTNKILIYILLLVFGAIIGMVNGFFGAGGGMICVPLLMLLGLKSKKAQATAILVMVPISIASAFVYYSNGFVDWQVVLYVAVGSVLGGVLGALLLKKLNNTTVQYIFALITLVTGVKMVFW